MDGKFNANPQMMPLPDFRQVLNGELQQAVEVPGL
jgi:hypothetical protein